MPNLERSASKIRTLPILGDQNPSIHERRGYIERKRPYKPLSNTMTDQENQVLGRPQKYKNVFESSLDLGYESPVSDAPPAKLTQYELEDQGAFYRERCGPVVNVGGFDKAVYNERFQSSLWPNRDFHGEQEALLVTVLDYRGFL
jgi:hypothetical protein